MTRLRIRNPVILGVTLCVAAVMATALTVRLALAGSGEPDVNNRFPNVGAIVVIGLGCEGLEPLAMLQAVQGLGKPARGIVIQDEGGSVNAIVQGATVADRMAEELSAYRREDVPASALLVGLECGGSDATSGLAANPALGAASDLLIAMGGTCILSETTESIGAEHVLARRAVDDQVRQKLLDIVRTCEERALQLGEDLRGSQPTPGNIAGGITTIEEKSLGCIHKAGSAPIQGVLSYGEIPAGRGLYVMDTPGMDVESMVGLAAGGVQTTVFTTGRGTPTGNPIMPVIKVTANRRTAERMADNIDLDVSGVIDGTLSLSEAGQRILDETLAVAGGKLTKAERLGHAEFSIHRIGPTF
jgi:altronate dehydratase large subunit